MKARRRAWMCGLAGFALALAGCNALQLNPFSSREPHVERDSTPGLPGKHSARVSQFVFFADFDIPRQQPIFKELSNLREQVFKELQLPPSNTVIQVYLFED